MTAPLTTLTRAVTNKRLLGAALGGDTWQTWFAVLKAAYAEPLTDAEREAFDRVAGGRALPTHKTRQLAVVASRRAGKGRAAGALAVFEAALHDHALAPGERGCVAVVSPTRAQAQIVKDYALGFLTSSPILRDQVDEVTHDEIKLKNGNVIVTLAADYRSLRGRTLLCAVIDEASFLRDETSASPDVECARALLPGLATTNGMLVVLSSPYRRAGLLYQLHRDHFGKDSDDVLCVAGASSVFNPSLDLAMIEAARAADPAAAMSEWDGEFRNDLSAFLPDDVIDGAIDHGRPLELPPMDDVIYFAFTDMAAGGRDASTVCICHREGERIIADVIRGRHGDPKAAALEFAALIRQYRCTCVTGDNFAKMWVSGTYNDAGLEYRRSPLVRSELYLEGLVSFTRGLVSIPDISILLRELRLLERRTARSGKDSVDHGGGGSDDYANALFGAMHVAVKTVEPVWAAILLSDLGGPVGDLSSDGMGEFSNAPSRISVSDPGDVGLGWGLFSQPRRNFGDFPRR